MCHPRSDRLIVELLTSGKLIADGRGLGTIRFRERDGTYRPATERVEQAGKRPAASEYRKVVMRVCGVVRSLRVHRIIWVAYNGPTHLEIDHIDDDALNCGIANLNAVTRLENETKKREAMWMREESGENRI